MATQTYHLKGANSTGPAGLMLTFTADDGSSDSDAKDVCQSVATLFGVDMVVYVEGDAAALNTASPDEQGSTVDCPSGVALVFGV